MTAEEFLQKVTTSTQHTSFYHFTDRKNLSLIRKHGGIMSMRYLRENSIDCPAPGGNEWSMDADRLFGVDRYVHLCFTTGHPMAYLAQQDGRISDIVWLRIDPSIIKRSGVKVTSDVSNKKGVVAEVPSVVVPTLDLEVIYTRTDWKDPAVNARLKTAEKYEILVPEIVPISYVLNPNG